MLSIKHVFEEDDIYTIEDIGGANHSVYKILGWGDGDGGKIDTLVVKMDAANTKPRNVASNLAFMNIVDPRARTEVLSIGEIAALKAWCSLHGIGGAHHLPVVTSITNSMSQNGAWTKMEVKRLTMLDSAIEGRQQGDKADVRIIARALKRHGGLEKLGEILAVDLFVGSSDRFCWPLDSEWPGLANGTVRIGDKYPGFTTKFLVAHNLGNVFIASGANGTGRPIGLDGFDPINYYRDFEFAIDLALVPWTGVAFQQKNAAKLRDWVGFVITDLETALGPRNRKSKHFSKKRLGSSRKDRLLKGIHHGESIMKRAVTGLRKIKTLPQGLDDRGSLLGWW